MTRPVATNAAATNAAAINSAVGDEIGPLVVGVDRARLVRYAGASGDFNPIHWNERVATGVGLDGVIAHGMLTMALAGRLVTDWAGDPGAVASFEVRFTRPVVVPDPGEAKVTIAGRVAEITDPPDGSRIARVDLTVTVAGAKVLGKARALVRL
jgi:acyl dehydratase